MHAMKSRSRLYTQDPGTVLLEMSFTILQGLLYDLMLVYVP